MQTDLLVLERGALRVEISPRPFAFTVRRNGRRLLRAAGVWVADGTVHDQFVSYTEGMIAGEDLAPHEPAQRAAVVGHEDDTFGITLALTLHGGRRARLTIA
ncbi:MAG TPA: hypothetical protein VGI27_11550, partial [Solirubrobacteraceae bacterium]